MRRRAFGGLLASASLASLAAGCVPSIGARKPTVVNVVIVTYPGGGAPPPVLSLYKGALQVTKANPGDYEINVTMVSPTMPDPSSGPITTPPTVTALEQALGQSPPPDVVLFSSGYEFAAALEKNLLAPLDDLARGERAFKLDDYFPGTIEAVSDQGKLYGVPLAAAPMVFQYDKRLFDAAGLGPPDASWNWSTLLNAAKQLTNPDAEGGPQYALNLMGQNYIPALVWQNGGEFATKDGRRCLLAEPAAVEAIKFYSDLMHVHKVAMGPPKPGPGGKPMMVERAIAIGPGEYPLLMGPGGRIAMQPMSGMAYAYGYGPFGKMGGSGDRPIRISELPRNKQQATTIELQSVLAVTSASPNPRAAFKALVALAAEMQADMVVPATRTGARRLALINPNIQEEEAKVLVASMEYGRSLPLYRQNQYMQPFYEKLMSPIMNGDKDPGDAAREAAQAIDEVLNKSLEELQTPVPSSPPAPASVPRG